MSEQSSEHEKLAEAIKKLLGSIKVYAVILFGSRARGDFKPWSDYDLLIIADFKEKYLDRIGKILELLSDIPLNIEPHPYTIDEAIEMLKRGNPTIVDALSEGAVLYSKSEFEVLIKLYKELLSKGLRKTKTSIIVPTTD